MEEEKAENTEVVFKLANRLVLSGLSVPAVFFLELYKPFCTFLGVGRDIFAPVFTDFFKQRRVLEVIKTLESRESVEAIICEIEKINQDNKNLAESTKKLI